MKVTNILFGSLLIFSKIKEKILRNSKEKKIIKDFSFGDRDYFKKNYLSYQPLISIITPIYKPNMLELHEYFNSILEYNSYKKLEFCFIIDGECEDLLIQYLNEIKEKYNILIKVKINTLNKGIALSTNEAIYMSTGEYLLFIDQDDYLSPITFIELLKILQYNKYDFIYTDESIVDNKKHLFFNFKPNFSPHTILSRMYINHLSVYKRDIVLKCLPLDKYFDGCQDYFLLLKSLKYIKNPYHINKILYHWRSGDNSVAKDINNKKYIIKKTEKLLKSHFSDNNLNVNIKAIDNKLIYNILFNEHNILKDLYLVIINTDKKVNYHRYKEIISNNKKKYLNIYIFDEFYNYEISLNLKKINFLYYKKFSYKNLNKYLLSLPDDKIILFSTTDINLSDFSIRQLSLTLSIPNTGIVSPCLINKNKRILKSGGIINKHKIYYAGVNEKYGSSDYCGMNHSLTNFTLNSYEVFFIKTEIYKLVHGASNYNFFKTIYLDLCLKTLKYGFYNVVNNNVYAIKNESKVLNYENICDKKDINSLKNNWGKELLLDRFYNQNLGFRINLLYKIK